MLVLSWASSLPIEIVSGLAGGPVAPLRLNRLLRIFLVDSYEHTITEALKTCGVESNAMVRRAPKLFVAMFLSSHWVGCLFHLLALAESKAGEEHTWASVDGLWEVTAANIRPMLSSSSASHNNYTTSNHTGGVGAQSATQVTMHSTLHEQYIRALYWAVITMVRRDEQC